MNYETISGNTFDSLLRICDIDPNTYWSDLEKWIDIKSGVYFGYYVEKTSDAIYYYM